MLKLIPQCSGDWKNNTIRVHIVDLFPFTMFVSWPPRHPLRDHDQKQNSVLQVSSPGD